MGIKVGDKIPNVDLTIFTESGPTTLSTAQVLGSGKAVLFAVPGAFTPTCSDYHLPSYVVRNEDLRAKGVGTIACLSVNDPFVMSGLAVTHRFQRTGRLDDGVLHVHDKQRRLTGNGPVAHDVTSSL